MCGGHSMVGACAALSNQHSCAVENRQERTTGLIAGPAQHASISLHLANTQGRSEWTRQRAHLHGGLPIGPHALS